MSITVNTDESFQREWTYKNGKPGLLCSVEHSKIVAMFSSSEIERYDQAKRILSAEDAKGSRLDIHFGKSVITQVDPRKIGGLFKMFVNNISTSLLNKQPLKLTDTVVEIMTRIGICTQYYGYTLLKAINDADFRLSDVVCNVARGLALHEERDAASMSANEVYCDMIAIAFVIWVLRMSKTYSTWKLLSAAASPSNIDYWNALMKNILKLTYAAIQRSLSDTRIKDKTKLYLSTDLALGILRHKGDLKPILALAGDSGAWLVKTCYECFSRSEIKDALMIRCLYVEMCGYIFYQGGEKCGLLNRQYINDMYMQWYEGFSASRNNPYIASMIMMTGDLINGSNRESPNYSLPHKMLLSEFSLVQKIESMFQKGLSSSHPEYHAISTVIGALGRCAYLMNDMQLSWLAMVSEDLFDEAHCSECEKTTIECITRLVDHQIGDVDTENACGCKECTEKAKDKKKDETKEKEKESSSSSSSSSSSKKEKEAEKEEEEEEEEEKEEKSKNDVSSSSSLLQIPQRDLRLQQLTQEESLLDEFEEAERLMRSIFIDKRDEPIKKPQQKQQQQQVQSTNSSVFSQSTETPKAERKTKGEKDDGEDDIMCVHRGVRDMEEPKLLKFEEDLAKESISALKSAFMEEYKTRPSKANPSVQRLKYTYKQGGPLKRINCPSDSLFQTSFELGRFVYSRQEQRVHLLFNTGTLFNKICGYIHKNVKDMTDIMFMNALRFIDACHYYHSTSMRIPESTVIIITTSLCDGILSLERGIDVQTHCAFVLSNLVVRSETVSREVYKTLSAERFRAFFNSVKKKAPTNLTPRKEICWLLKNMFERGSVKMARDMISEGMFELLMTVIEDVSSSSQTDSVFVDELTNTLEVTIRRSANKDQDIKKTTAYRHLAARKGFIALLRGKAKNIKPETRVLLDSLP